uniref:receptor protein-tyrosine kinase n=1 Tax=Acrobeloides nanus TaxID=290746 RepID=A0A914BWQ8_9BILA
MAIWLHLLFMSLFMFIISFSYELSPSKCDEENKNKPWSDLTKCKRCDSDNPVNCCTSCSDKYIPIESCSKCVQKCLDDQYVQGKKCLKCNDSCTFGCNGPSSLINEVNGCKRCKYGIVEKGDKKCLKAKKDHLSVCRDNSYTNFYPEEAEGIETTWAEFVCKECPKNCLKCDSNGSSPTENGCVCKNFIIADGKVPYCSSQATCPEGFTQINEYVDGISNKYCTSCKYGKYNATKKCCTENGECVTNGVILWYLSIFIVVTILIIIVIIALVCFRWNSIYKNKRSNLEQNQNANIYDIESAPLNNEASNSQPSNSEPSTIDSKLTSDSEDFLLSSNKPFPKPDDELAERLRNNQLIIGQLFVSELEVQINEKAILGEGEFGVVHKGIFRGIPVAVKVIKSSDEVKRALKEEARIMDSCKHKHIQSLIAVCPGSRFLMISALQEGGALLTFLQTHQGQLELRYLYLYCAQIADGMNYLVEKNILHSDLAARNILMKNNEHILVSDFGLSKALEKEDGTRIYGKVAWRWLSLECLCGQMATHENDTWAYGVTCWEIFHFCTDNDRSDKRLEPYKKLKINTPVELYQLLVTGGRLERPEKYCDKKTFWKISDCWNKNLKDRPTFKMLSAFFSEIALMLKNEDFYETEIYDDDENQSTSEIEYDSYTDSSEDDSDVLLSTSTESALYHKGAASYQSYSDLSQISQSSTHIRGRSSFHSLNRIDSEVSSIAILNGSRNSISSDSDSLIPYPRARILSDSGIRFNLTTAHSKQSVASSDSDLSSILVLSKSTQSLSTESGIYSSHSGKRSNDSVMAEKYQALKQWTEVLETHTQAIQKNKILPEQFLACVNCSILKALEQCFNENIVHGNIQANNVLMNKSGQVKLCDLRMSYDNLCKPAIVVNLTINLNK